MLAESYHCICGTLVLVLPGYANLAELPRRKAEGLQETPILVIKSDIDPQSAMLNSTLNKTAQVVRRPDGFEKRWLWRCNRCKIPWAYELKVEQESENDSTGRMMCLLVDSLTSTEALKRAADESGD